MSQRVPPLEEGLFLHLDPRRLSPEWKEWISQEPDPLRSTCTGEGGRLQQDLDIRSYNGSSYWDNNREGVANQAVAKGPVLQLPLAVLDPGGKNV